MCVCVCVAAASVSDSVVTVSVSFLANCPVLVCVCCHVTVLWFTAATPRRPVKGQTAGTEPKFTSRYSILKASPVNAAVAPTALVVTTGEVLIS